MVLGMRRRWVWDDVGGRWVDRLWCKDLKSIFNIGLCTNSAC